jgi:hypothetical protein
MNTSYKSDYLSLFTTSIFPQNVIQKDCLRHKELLFSEFPAKPDLLLKQNKNFQLANCFIPRKDGEDDLNIKKNVSSDNFSSSQETISVKPYASKTPKAGASSGWKRGENHIENPSTLKSFNFVDGSSMAPSNAATNLNFGENLNIFQKANDRASNNKNKQEGQQEYKKCK